VVKDESSMRVVEATFAVYDAEIRVSGL